MAVGVAWCGELEDGERVLAPLRVVPARPRPRRPDAVRRAPVDARRDGAARLALLRPAALPRDVSDDFIDALVDGFECVPRRRRTSSRRGWAAPSTASLPARRRSATAARGHSPGSSAARATSRSTRSRLGAPRLGGHDGLTPPAASTSTRSTSSGPFATRTPTRSGTGSSRSSAATTRTAPSPATGSAGAQTSPFAHGVRGRLGAAAHAELREHASDVVLGGLRRDHEPVGDLGVRQPRRDQAQDLALARGELVALAAGRGAARDAELAQQRRRRGRRRARRRAPRRSRRRARRGEREWRAAGRLDSREREPRPGRLEREAQRREAGDGVLELRRCRRGPAGRAAPPRRRRSSPCRSLGQRPQAAGRRSPPRRGRPLRARARRGGRRARARRVRSPVEQRSR